MAEAPTSIATGNVEPEYDWTGVFVRFNPEFAQLYQEVHTAMLTALGHCHREGVEVLESSVIRRVWNGSKMVHQRGHAQLWAVPSSDEHYIYLATTFETVPVLYRWAPGNVVMEFFLHELSLEDGRALLDGLSRMT